MNKKKRNIIILIVVIVVIAILLAVFLSGGEKEAPVSQVETPIENEASETSSVKMEIPEEVTELPANEPEPEVYSFNSEEEEVREMTAEDLKQLAFAIAERYGSYSNEGNFGNISDLELYMTDEMKTWAKTYVETERAKPYTGEYYGMSTTALVGEVVSFEDDEAEVLVSTRRKEIKNNEENVFDQKITINFSKIGSEWKVSGAYWQ
ncbi:MAG: hypothetical protein K9M44_02065 [Candidatus Pacebacteria bacterium]|nr:hypothetical protein [Candidatus Paceibacterota bacterium]